MNATPEEAGTKTAPLWIGAIFAAILLHAGVALAISLAAPADEDPDALGAPAIEIGFELAAPQRPPTDLPPGPQAEASAASPAVVEQKERVEQSALPKATPTQIDDPDRMVARDASKKPREDDPKPAETQAQPAAEAVASEATAMPTIETAKQAIRSTAPAEGIGDSAKLVRMTWRKKLVAYLDHHKRYPEGRGRRSAEVVVEFTLDRVGHVLTARVATGSGDAAFDEAALAMLRRADPVPRPPPLIADGGLDFTLPVRFRAK